VKKPKYLEPLPSPVEPAAVELEIAGKRIGPGQPVFVIAEIGINHNGSLELARRLIDGAVLAGCDAVKFQKRTPEICVPRSQWEVQRDTPWGRMTYLEYKKRIEFNEPEYVVIDRYCRERNIAWFASAWDEESVAFLERFEPPCYKAASASITDLDLLRAMRKTGRPLIMSTGMSTLDEIRRAVQAVSEDKLALAHTTSAYPCPPELLNLKMISTLRELYPRVPIGYSGHESGLTATWAAVGMGATFVERHITLDKAMWGTDQSASIDVVELVQLVAHIRSIERALGDGVKRVHESELLARSKLRRPEAAQSLAASEAERR
jgi:N-acetylneuraminate synthase